MMHRFFIVVLSVAMLVSGCATKKYVRNNVSPVQAKLDQVAEQANKQGEQLQQTQKDVEKNSTEIAAVNEKATGADRRAADAMNRAQQADQKATQNSQQINNLRSTVANLDNYKVVQTATVLFPFNSAKLMPDEKQQLDQLVSQTNGLKRYYISIEGFTDATGDPQYNLNLSERRADAVVHYLVGEKDVDFNRIHTIGLGEMKPAAEGKTKEDRAKNRRVEIKVYSADDALQGLQQSGEASAQTSQRGSN